MCINYKPESWEWLLLPAFTLRIASFVACLFLCFDMSMTFSRNSESIFPSSVDRHIHTFYFIALLHPYRHGNMYLQFVLPQILSPRIVAPCVFLLAIPISLKVIWGVSFLFRASRRSTFTNSFSFLFSSFSFSLRIFFSFC